MQKKEDDYFLVTLLLCLPTHLVITEFVHPRSVLLCLLTDYVITEFAHFRPVLLCLPTHCVIAEFARQRRAGVCRMGGHCHPYAGQRPAGDSWIGVQGRCDVNMIILILKISKMCNG